MRVTLARGAGREAGVEPGQGGRALDQPARWLVEARVDLGGEVVVELEVGGAEALQDFLERAGFRPAQRLVHEVHSGRPTQGRLLQGLQLVLSQRAAVDLVEQAREFFAREPQMSRVQLEDVAARTHALESERREGSRGEEHAHRVRQQAEQHFHECVDRRLAGHLLVVVQHEQHAGAAQGGELVREGPGEHLGRAGAGFHVLERAVECASESWSLAAKSFQQVAAEHDEVGIRGHERIPHNGPMDAEHELGEQGGPAIALGRASARGRNVRRSRLERRAECVRSAPSPVGGSMKAARISIAVLLAALAAAPACANFSGGSKSDEEKPATPGISSFSMTPREEAEHLYADGRDEALKAKKDLEAGKTKNAEKKFRKALDRGERAVAIDPQYHEAWNLIGYSSRHLKNYDHALVAYDKCLSIKPDYTLAREYLGEAYLEMGNLAK